MRKTIIVNSAKGGVGKTESSVEIARGLANSGETVYLLDLDITTPNASSEGGYTLISSPLKMDLSKTQLKKFIRDSYASMEKDCYVIVDTPPTITGTYSAMVEGIKNAKFIFVTTPSKNAKSDTALGIKFFAQRGIVASGIIQNMVGGPFGESFDSDIDMGVPTIGVVPLLEEGREKYFEPIVDIIKTFEFKKDTEIEKSISRKVLGSVTMADIEKGLYIPPMFYNLETWEHFREEILETDNMGNHGFAKSRHDVGVKEIEKILAMGETANVMIRDVPIAASNVIPWEIQEADIVYDNKVSKGLPMFRLSNGTHLWMQEVMITDNQTIKDIIEEGGIELGQGRVVQDLFQTLYLERSFKRNSISKEPSILKTYLEVTNVDLSAKEIVYMLAVLANDRSGEDFVSFDVDQYIKELEKEGRTNSIENIVNMTTIIDNHGKEPIISTLQNEVVTENEATVKRVSN